MDFNNFLENSDDFEKMGYDELIQFARRAGKKAIENPIIKQEISMTGRVKGKTIQQVFGYPEFVAMWVVRLLEKDGHFDAMKHAEFERSQQPATDDSYFYHVTLKSNLPAIKRKGLSNATPPIMTNYANHSKGRIFLSDVAGVKYWKERVSQHYFHNTGSDPKLAVLRVRKDVVEVQPDEIGTKDSRVPSYFSTSPIAADHIEIVEVD